jgi:hypothetical protein
VRVQQRKPQITVAISKPHPLSQEVKMQNEANVNLGHLWVNVPSDEGHEGTKVNRKEEKVVPLSMQRFAASPEELQNEPTSPFPRVAPSFATGVPTRRRQKCKTNPKPF